MTELVMPKILYIEDNEDNVYMLRRRLERRGYSVIVAENGAVGVDRAKAERPDLILMDLSLPVMDGWEAARRLKDLAETRSIPIIALSAHVLEGEKAKALAAGCDEYDTKPIDLARLVGKIETLLQGGVPS
jgi:CheY-like chemotaxis protein